MKFHMTSFFLGFILDLMLGDPVTFPHPVRLMGRAITVLEHRLLKTEQNKTIVFCKGLLMAALVIAGTAAVTFFLLLESYCLNPYIGLAVETIMTYQIFAMKCLKQESMKVFWHLKDGNLQQARFAVSMIVGRDTECLDKEGIIKATVETVAENTSDGVIAPMLYLAIGGPVLGFLYKAVNTMDSMVGYKNDKYLYFGRAAAKLDDIVNFIPARISAYFMIAAAFLLEKCFRQKNCSWKHAFFIYKRDCRKHASPNAAQTESVCAGALGIQLAGDAAYFGKTVKKPYIGEAIKEIECEDIRRANRLMYLSSWICAALCLIFMMIYQMKKCCGI